MTSSGTSGTDGPPLFNEAEMQRAAALVNHVGGSMGPHHATITPQQVALVIEMLEAAGMRVEGALTPTLDDVADALRDEDLHDEAFAYWEAPVDGERHDDRQIAGLLTWLADFLPQHIDEMREGVE